MQYHCKDTLERQSIVYWNCWLAVLLFAWRSVDKDVIECYYDIAVIGGDPYHVNQWPLAKAFRTINSLYAYNGLQWITLVDLSNTCSQSANLTSWHSPRVGNSSVKIESRILRPLQFFYSWWFSENIMPRSFLVKTTKRRDDQIEKESNTDHFGE